MVACGSGLCVTPHYTGRPTEDLMRPAGCCSLAMLLIVLSSCGGNDTPTTPTPDDTSGGDTDRCFRHGTDRRKTRRSWAPPPSPRNGMCV